MLESLFPLADPDWEKPLVAVVFVGANDAALPSRQQHGKPVRQAGRQAVRQAGGNAALRLGFRTLASSFASDTPPT